MRYGMMFVALSMFLALPTFADEPAPISQEVSAAAVTTPSGAARVTTVTLTTEQLKQLVAATPVPAPATPAKTAVISAETGILGMSWSTIGSILAAILGVVFMFWKGATAVRVQKAIPDAIDAAYWFTERNFGDLPGPQKFLMALGHLYEGLTGHGLTLNADTVAKASTRWQLLSNDPTSTLAPPPSAQAMADAAAKSTAAKVLADPAETATALAERASK